MPENSTTIEQTVSVETEHNHQGSACICGHDHSEGVGHTRSMGRLRLALVGAIFVINSYVLNWIFAGHEFAAEISALIGAIILAYPIFSQAMKDLYYGKVHMNELVALALLAAFAAGDFRLAGTVSFFLLITIIIETRTASGAQRSIENLVKLTPNTANIIVDGAENEVDVLSLNVGDTIRVRPGENFPVDGKIISGESTVNQAPITGESLPLDKDIGDEVYAGTMNLTGSIEVKVTKVGEDTTLGKVKDMILAAEGSKPPIIRMIDKYAGYYTPTILMLAGITWWFSQGDMSRVITLLIIACPCAVVLATPSAVVAAIAAAARLGIFIKNVADLELAAKIKYFVFDKTGTLTEGILSVARLTPSDGVEPAELLLTAASIETHSNHPTAKALQAIAEEAGLELKDTPNFSEVHGKGVEAEYEGSKCYVGRGDWLKSFDIDISGLKDPDADEHAGMSVVYVAKNGKVVGWIGFKDKIRREANTMISELKKEGVRYCAMVTGDRSSVAEKVAGELNIDELKSECLPETKVEFVENVKKSSTVAVVGDGVNDAPALAAGDLGIAMGAIGSDIAINSASIALMTNDLRRIPILVYLSKKSTVIINQNLLMGLLFVIGGIICSVLGYMTPITAAVLHTLSTLVVLFNSARLVRTGEELCSKGDS